MNIDDYLHHLQKGGDRVFMQQECCRYTYAMLSEYIQRYDSWLLQHGISNSAILISTDYGIESIALLFALWKNRNIVAIVGGQNEKALHEKAQAAGCSHIITLNNAGDLQLQAFKFTLRPQRIDALLQTQQMGFVIFTSGSTGVPKGVVHLLQPFLTRYASEESCGVMLAFLLFDHIGGLVTILQALANHSSLVIPAERTPHEVGRCIEQFAIETLHVSPTLLNLVYSAGALQDMQHLKRIYFGSEPAPEALLTRISTRLPDVELRQLYGMSEIGVLPCISHPHQKTWFRVDDERVQLRVVEGILQVKSPTNMLGYLTHDGDITPDGFLITGDMVEQEGDYFHISGRAKDMINVGGKKVMPSAVEDVLRQMDNVADVVVYGQSNPLLGEIVAAMFYLHSPEALNSVKERLYAFIRDRLSAEQYPRVITLSETPLHTNRFKKMRKPPVVSTPTA